MAISLDTYGDNSGAGFANSFSINGGTPEGVVCMIPILGGFDEQVTGVTYGGNAMTEMSLSPFEASSGELNGIWISAWILESGAPSGTQTVAVSGPSASLVGVFTFDADGNGIEEVDTSTFQSTSVSNANVTLSLGGETCYCLEGWGSGENSVGQVSPKSGWTSRIEYDAGTFCAGIYSYDTIGSTDVSAGLVQSSDDAHILAVAVRAVPAASPGANLLTLLGVG